MKEVRKSTLPPVSLKKKVSSNLRRRSRKEIAVWKSLAEQNKKACNERKKSLHKFSCTQKLISQNDARIYPWMDHHKDEGGWTWGGEIKQTPQKKTTSKLMKIEKFSFFTISTTLEEFLSFIIRGLKIISCFFWNYDEKIYELFSSHNWKNSQSINVFFRLLVFVVAGGALGKSGSNYGLAKLWLKFHLTLLSLRPLWNFVHV